jgi:hypothetical protein
VGLSYSWQRLGGTVDDGFGTEERRLLVVSGLSSTTPETLDFGSLSISYGRFTPVALVTSQIGGKPLLDVNGNPLALVASIGTPALTQTYIPSIDTSIAFPSLDRPVLSLSWAVTPADNPPPVSLLIGNVPAVGTVLAPRLNSSISNVEIAGTVEVSLTSPETLPPSVDAFYGYIGTVLEGALAGGLPVVLTLTDSGQTVSQSFSARLRNPTLSLANVQSASTANELFTLSIYGSSPAGNTNYWRAVIGAPGTGFPPVNRILVLPDLDFSNQASISLSATATTSGITGQIMLAGGSTSS